MPFKGKKLPEDTDIAKLSGVDQSRRSVRKFFCGPRFRKQHARRGREALGRSVSPQTGDSQCAESGMVEKSDRRLYRGGAGKKRGLGGFLRRPDKRTLVRRVYIDLIGVPPTRLKSGCIPGGRAARRRMRRSWRGSWRVRKYGERWGRHLLDIWRYSDWYGYRAQNQVRYSQRHIWRWRDWTVESL